MIGVDNITGVLLLTADFWKKLGVGSNNCIKFWIKEDASKGIMQNNTSGYQYSEQYAKYKANDMRRFTVDYIKKNGKTGRKPGEGKRLGSSTGKIGYATGSLSNETAFVNMRLTGATLDGLDAKTSDENSVTMAFNSADTQKLLGCRELGYDIIGLNTENTEKARQRIIEAYKKNVGKMPKKVTIYVR